MARLYSDLLSGTSQRYYFGLNSAPGGITNATPAMLTLFGRTPVAQEQIEVFRTPATAALTLFGYARSSGSTINAGLATLTLSGPLADEQRLQVITNALPPDYTALPDNAPTILYIATITPAPATLTTQSLEHNITQGGNIGFVSPGKATLTLSGLTAALPRFADVGAITVNGRAATLVLTLNITPGVGALVCSGLAQSLSLPFIWIDDDPVSPPTWIDDPRA